MHFDHEKLDVFQIAMQWIKLCERIVSQLPRGRAYLADQLQRAGTSIPFNIAEGAGEYASQEKSRFYRIAKRSAVTYSSHVDETCEKRGSQKIVVTFRTRARAQARLRE